MRFNPKLIDFFKKHRLYNEEMFKYFEEHSTMIDGDYDDERMITGCAYLIDRNTGILKGIHLNLPYIKPNAIDEELMLDSIHELTHAIFTYPRIGKKFNRDITIETLPLLYEKLYIMENPSPISIAYGHRLDDTITDKYPEYAFALKVRDELYHEYHKNPEEMAKMVHKKGKKYQFEQFKNKFHHK
jgi:hypothetical protein